MRSRPWRSTTRRSLGEFARDERNLLPRDPVDDNLAGRVSNDVLGDPPQWAFIRPVLVADAHHDQVRVLFAGNLDDSVAGLAGDVDLGARRMACCVAMKAAASRAR